MPSSVPLLALGVRVDVALPGEDAAILEPLVQGAWSRCRYAGPDPAALTLSVSAEPGSDVTGSGPEEVLDNLAMRINREVTRARAGELFMMHAACLADPVTGAAIALSAPSGTGKTTACVTLGRELGYLSDEVAGVAADGSLVPYAKPLSVIEPETTWRKSSTSPDTLGLAPAPDAAHLAAVVLLERSADGPGEPEVETLPLLDSLAAMAGNTFQLARHAQPLHTAAAHFRRVDGVRRVRYREADSLMPLVREWLS
ncbi:MAG: hypothetical protein QM572_15660 [Nocardioides sp.]|uniref:hypothetical protein n=1 Tax=Nocardioides sp. TaxID=35761 RepID=UPI0039E4D059